MLYPKVLGANALEKSSALLIFKDINLSDSELFGFIDN